MSGDMIDLADAIEGLRKDLIDAMRRGDGQPLQFQLDPVEVTLETVVTKELGGKIGWKVLEASGSREKEATQTVKLRLTPLWRSPDGTLNKEFAIAAAGPAGFHFEFGDQT